MSEAKPCACERIPGEVLMVGADGAQCGRCGGIVFWGEDVKPPPCAAALEQFLRLLRPDPDLLPVYLAMAGQALRFTNGTYTTREVVDMVPAILREAVIREHGDELMRAATDVVAPLLAPKTPPQPGPAERYQRDPNFRALVDMLESAIHEAKVTPFEVREAALLACVRHQERTWRRVFVPPTVDVSKEPTR